MEVKVAFLQLLVRLIDGLNERVGIVISWLTTLMVLVVCYDVFTRYFLRSSSVAVQELEWHLFAVIFLIGAAYTLKHEGHVRVDVFYSRMTPRGKAIIDLLGGLVFLIPFALLVIWTSQKFINMSWMTQETSPDPGGLPYRYLLKSMISLGFVLVLLQGIAMSIRAFLTIIGRPLADPSATTPAVKERDLHA
jgi:TRAP-type mannitol/chloroaromatic compound transport system permease small subunit